MEHCILQNNAVNIYQKYFEECEQAAVVEPCSSRTVNVYRDQTPNKRPISHLSWSPDGGTKLAVAHCITKFQAPQNDVPTDCYIWDIGKIHTINFLYLHNVKFLSTFRKSEYTVIDI